MLNPDDRHIRVYQKRTGMENDDHYIKEGRMAWPLTWVVILGTLPGVFIGYFIRVLYLPDPETFRLFVCCVLLLIGGQTVL
jgi:hypothetical protein